MDDKQRYSKGRRSKQAMFFSPLWEWEKNGSRLSAKGNYGGDCKGREEEGRKEKGRETRRGWKDRWELC